jgi:Arc/MetJ family transcription regulator
VTKRLIDIDDELLKSARQELGISGIADTGNRAGLRAPLGRGARITVTGYSAGA